MDGRNGGPNWHTPNRAIPSTGAIPRKLSNRVGLFLHLVSRTSLWEGEKVSTMQSADSPPQQPPPSRHWLRELSFFYQTMRLYGGLKSSLLICLACVALVFYTNPVGLMVNSLGLPRSLLTQLLHGVSSPAVVSAIFAYLWCARAYRRASASLATVPGAPQRLRHFLVVSTLLLALGCLSGYYLIFPPELYFNSPGGEAVRLRFVLSLARELIQMSLLILSLTWWHFGAIRTPLAGLVGVVVCLMEFAAFIGAVTLGPWYRLRYFPSIILLEFALALLAFTLCLVTLLIGRRSVEPESE